MIYFHLIITPSFKIIFMNLIDLEFNFYNYEFNFHLFKRFCQYFILNQIITFLYFK